MIASEIGRLRSVAIHRPGPELDLMTPGNIEAYHVGHDGAVVANPDYLLFDDLVQLSRLRAEHDAYVSVLQATCGRENTREVRDLLRSMLHDPATRAEAIAESVRVELETTGASPDDAICAELEGLDPHALLGALIRGRLPDGRVAFRWPLPNLLFARDLGAVVGQNVILSHGSKPARRREMALMRALFRHGVSSAGQATLSVLDVALAVPNATIEGGDVMVISPEVVLIGVGERTTLDAARQAARLVLNAQPGLENVHLITLHASRATMHLDTVFTIVDHGLCLIYSPMLRDRNGLDITTVSRTPNGVRTQSREGTLLDVLRTDGIALDAVECGGHDPIHQQREQWTDGANAFALAPGKIVLYARNERTLIELNACGFEVLSPSEWCRNATLLLASPGRRALVTIDGTELSRGRGGPRCLTLPLLRDAPSPQPC